MGRLNLQGQGRRRRQGVDALAHQVLLVETGKVEASPWILT